MATPKTSSPFLTPHTHTTPNTLSIIHLKRNNRTPIILSTNESNDTESSYFEEAVLNTRFGSFPHRTFLNLPWGSQVRASIVDTGSRGKKGKKRKRGDDKASAAVAGEADGSEDTPNTVSKDGVMKETVVADSGFVHILPPTPENWTASLPHRTQIVYTSDYSYILQRLRVRPGTKIIEAGAGSGSFSHAAARAVFDGYPNTENGVKTGDVVDNEAQSLNGAIEHSQDEADTDVDKKKRKPKGKVYSFEFHAQRYEKLTHEISNHGLQDVIHITHRDVCKDGFLVGENQDESPSAEVVFLDLPAPWIALPHLSRRPQPTPKPPTPTEEIKQSEDPTTQPNQTETQPSTWTSPLSPTTPIRLCTFSPCIEQVQRTVSALRRLGWIDISMVEIANKRIDIRRERGGITAATAGPNTVLPPASVDEAIGRLREVEGRWKVDALRDSDPDAVARVEVEAEGEAEAQNGAAENASKKQKKGKKTKASDNNGQGGNTRLSGPAAIEAMIARKTYKEGILVHRSEPDIKTHTSYLVFAVLPREWMEKDEERARRRFGGGGVEKKEEKGEEGGEGAEAADGGTGILEEGAGDADGRQDVDVGISVEIDI